METPQQRHKRLHPDRVKAAGMRYRKKYPERVKQQSLRSQAKLRSTDPEYHRRWREKNKEKSILSAAASHLRTKYNLTLAQYDAILKKQGGACAICNTTNPGPPTKGGGLRRYFCVDHNHATGKVRGLLCHHCNCALGHLRESPDLFRAAMKYLKR